MKDVHEGLCESHIKGKTLSGKIIRVRQYWLSMLQNCARFLNSCQKCLIYALFIHSPTELLHSISPWPFYQWGYDILRHFPLVVGKLKFLIVAMGYFTKWKEAKVVPWIPSEKIRRFYQRNIICCFGLQGIIVFDNIMQFARSSVVEFCRHLDIQNRFVLVEHPHANGHTKEENMIILSRMKKKLDEANGLWA